MKNSFRLINNTLSIMYIALIVGLSLIFLSTPIAETYANNVYFHAHSMLGGLDGNQYNRLVNNTAMNIRFAGLAITLFGSHGILMCYYARFKEIGKSGT